MERKRPTKKDSGRVPADACGPMALRWVLAKDNRAVALKILMKDCKVKEDGGSWTATMLSALVRQGYRQFVSQDVTWDQVEELLPTCHIVISWWTIFFPTGEDEGGGAHWSAIDSLTRFRVGLYDPMFECVVQYPREVIDGHWAAPEYNGPAGILNDECRLAIFVPRRPLRKRKSRARP